MNCRLAGPRRSGSVRITRLCLPVCRVLPPIIFGSVDDGESELIGRLLYESKTIFEGQLAAIERDSHKWDTRGKEPDAALLVDGLTAVREQGIVVGVARGGDRSKADECCADAMFTPTVLRSSRRLF